jgi:hypothetical protein
MKADQPATIPTAALAFAGTIAPLLGVILQLDQATIAVLSAFILGGAGLAVAIYLNKTTTSSNAPVVDAGTEVGIIGSDKTVTAEIPPAIGDAPPGD